jgi:hypothetical protein
MSSVAYFFAGFFFGGFCGVLIMALMTVNKELKTPDAEETFSNRS